MTIEIPLSQTSLANHGKYTALISDEDSILAGFYWNILITKRSNTVYAKRANNTKGKISTETLHKVVMERVLGHELPQGAQIDHIDGDGLNCQRDNLRLANHSQNAANRKRLKNNTSGYKGVSFHKQTGKWRATIKFQGKSISIGGFGTPEKAHEEYCKKAKELFGDFANDG